MSTVDQPRDTRATTTPTDVSRLLAVDSKGARIITTVFFVSNALFTFATIDIVASPWPSIIAMVLINGAVLLLARPHNDPFPLRDTLIIVGVVITSTLLISSQLPVEGYIGRASWHLGANTWLVFFLALRRRAGFAWLGLVLMAAITIGWTHTSGRGIGQGIAMVQTHAGILLVATLFASNLRHTSQRINEFNERSVEAAASYAAADAAQEIRRQRVAELASAVVPLLEQISRGEPISDADRQEYRATEATLRDGVRGRSLAVPSVVEATRAARNRGVEVSLLDDRGAPLQDGPATQRISVAIVDALAAAKQGSVTVRLAPEGRAVALSIVTNNGKNNARIELDSDGTPLVLDDVLSD
ncbi:MAG: hypothetical protein CVT64_01450 [Actinobacteria bacterium HGW-Actinobacteria-4]|nr:MAG: hypothetical protein CVT64_01450 [Actinobacteria bacterium HGW-Actinobacteria-4]